ncbi:hypothetical protein PAHAL_1G329900 [Panicum hallii]|uniref:Uncharacterized protein n=1 Tax=Panicum hallii TaxID=206008 RepID=A0A2S3GRN8_9POAL|nr:hypothetical protein PAHAL_1G329900 [Panicum hallii]
MVTSGSCHQIRCHRRFLMSDSQSSITSFTGSVVIGHSCHQIDAKLVGIGRRHRQICSHQLLRAAKLAVISGHQSPITLH